MKLFCIHCGKPILTKIGATDREARCLGCGKTTLVPGGAPAQDRSAAAPAPSQPAAARSRTKDFVIVGLALVVVVLLAWLLLRPDQSGVRRIVFGDIGAKPPASGGSGNGIPPTAFPGARSGNGEMIRDAGPAGVQAGGGAGGGLNTGGGSPLGPAGQGGVGGPGRQPGAAESVDGGGLQKEGEPARGTPPSTSGLVPGGPVTGPSGTAPGSGPGTAGGGVAGKTPGAGGNSLSGTAAGSTPQNSPPEVGDGIKPPPTGAAPGGGAATSPVTGPGSPGAPPPGQTPAPPGPTTETTPPPAPNPLTGRVPPAVPPAKGSQPIAPPLEVSKETTEELLNGPKNQPPPAPPGAVPAEKSDGQKGSPGDPAGSGGGGGGRGEERKQPPEGENKPFDAQTGTNVAFVLDRSLSMRGEKSDRARRELVDTLGKLGPGKSFNVVFFPYEAMPGPAPLPATSENIRSITNWLFSLGHSFGSDPMKAVEHGLAFKPDTLWLLSDGKFAAKIPEAIRAANATAKAHIHSVGLYDTSGETSMRQISEENGGTFRFVPKPGSPIVSPAARPPALPK